MRRMAAADRARRPQPGQRARSVQVAYTGHRTASCVARSVFSRPRSRTGPACSGRSPPSRRSASAASAGAVERVSRRSARKQTLDFPCPDCGGQIDVHGRSGAAPLALCTVCGWIWSEQELAAQAYAGLAPIAGARPGTKSSHARVTRLPIRGGATKCPATTGA